MAKFRIQRTVPDVVQRFPVSLTANFTSGMMNTPPIRFNSHSPHLITKPVVSRSKNFSYKEAQIVQKWIKEALKKEYYRTLHVNMKGLHFFSTQACCFN